MEITGGGGQTVFNAISGVSDKVDSVSAKVNSTDTKVALAEVVGAKNDAAVTTVGTVATIMAYLKGVLNQLAGLVTSVNTISTNTQSVNIPGLIASDTVKLSAPTERSYVYVPATLTITKRFIVRGMGTVRIKADLSGTATQGNNCTASVRINSSDSWTNLFSTSAPVNTTFAYPNYDVGKSKDIQLPNTINMIDIYVAVTNGTAYIKNVTVSWDEVPGNTSVVTN